MSTAKPETKLARTAHGSGRIFKMDPSDVVINDELNGRFRPHSKHSVKEMADSIKQHGQKQPVEVRYDSDGNLVLVFGFRRAKAVQMLNEKGTATPLWVKLVEYESDREALVANIIENADRADTTPLDDAHNIQMLKQAGIKPAQVLKIYGGKSKTWMYDLLSLLKLPADIQEKIADGILLGSVGRRLIDIKEDELREELFGRVRNNEILTVEGVESAIREYHAERIESGQVEDGPEDEAEQEDSEDEEQEDSEDEEQDETEDDSDDDAGDKPKRRKGKKKASKRKKATKKTKRKKPGRSATLKSVKAVVEMLAEQKHPQLAAMGVILKQFIDGRLTERGVLTKLKKYGRENPGGLLDGEDFDQEEGDESGEE